MLGALTGLAARLTAQPHRRRCRPAATALSGHDAWTVGDQPFVVVDFSSQIAQSAKQEADPDRDVPARTRPR
jgi:hypothetical protein